MKRRWWWGLIGMTGVWAQAYEWNTPQLTAAQATLIRQDLLPFAADYSGPLSLRHQGDVSSTYTAGVYLGWQAGPWTQVYSDFERFDGSGISAATGLASITDGDAVRAGTQGLPQRIYTARAYIRQLIPLDTSMHTVERAQDQLAGAEADRQIELKMGVLAVNDDFDKNRYANNTRNQFMNWSLINNTAWDFAADTRGYTSGMMLAWQTPQWTWRAGVYRMPRFANAMPLAAIDQGYGLNTQLTWREEGGRVWRILAYQNHADMGSYADALALARASGSVPDITATRQQGRLKTGLGLNLEQPWADDGETGAFMRLGWDDGHTESFAYTEMDRVFSLGVQVSGRHWRRPQDHWGLAYVAGGLSPAHANYLAAGGQGFVLGDGALSYGPEQLVETYYRCQLLSYLQLSPDLQVIQNPGFNRARGPVTVLGARLHLEY